VQLHPVVSVLSQGQQQPHPHPGPSDDRGRLLPHDLDLEGPIEVAHGQAMGLDGDLGGVGSRVHPQADDRAGRPLGERHVADSVELSQLELEGVHDSRRQPFGAEPGGRLHRWTIVVTRRRMDQRPRSSVAGLPPGVAQVLGRVHPATEPSCRPRPAWTSARDLSS
jgi:hypothetical protein